MTSGSCSRNSARLRIASAVVLLPLLAACGDVPRERFVPPAFQSLAFSDTGIDIGHGQSMMAPKIEARLLQSLNIAAADRVLEIGTGSGYLTALLGTLGAHVTSIEYHADLSEGAAGALRECGISNVTLHVGDGLDGWASAEPYDAIAVTGSCPQRRAAIEQQLSINGRMFVVVGEAPVMTATLITRISKDAWAEEALFETELAPLIGAEHKPEFKF